MRESAVILFCGEPRRDERQKRLPRRFLATLHGELRRTVLATGAADLLIAAGSGDRMTLTGPDIAIERETDSLADRIDLALRLSFEAGYRRVVILAGDTVALTEDILAAALVSLQSPGRRMVLGCSSDGGFYLAGFNEIPVVDWNVVLEDRDFAAATLAAAAGMALQLLPVVDDIDSREDAVRLLPLLPARCASLLKARATHRIERPRHPQPALRECSSLRAPPAASASR